MNIPSEASSVGGNQKTRPISLFLLTTYAISWSIWMGGIYSGGLRVSLRILTFHPFTLPVNSVLAVAGSLGPGIAAILLTGIRGGTRGVADLLRPLLRWRVGWGWYLFALGLTAALELSVWALFVQRGVRASHLVPWYAPVTLFFVNLPLGPLWEEIGWRGYLLPGLQSTMSGVASSVWIGLAWGLWHIPLDVFLIPLRSAPLLSFAWFLMTIVPMSVFFTLLYNKTGGSLLLVVLFHAAHNAVSTTIYYFVAPDSAFLSMLMLLAAFLWIGAAVAVIRTGKGLGLRNC